MSAKLKKKHSYEIEYEEVPSYRNSSQLDFLNYNARHLTSYLPALLFLDVGPGLYDSLIGWVQAYFKRCRAEGKLSQKKKKKFKVQWYSSYNFVLVSHTISTYL